VLSLVISASRILRADPVVLRETRDHTVGVARQRAGDTADVIERCPGDLPRHRIARLP
jgi:hypothetical protein